MKEMNVVIDKEADRNLNQFDIEQNSVVSNHEAMTKPFVYPAAIEEREKRIMHERTAKRAYFIWQKSGSATNGDSFRNWMEAEDLIFVEQEIENVI